MPCEKSSITWKRAMNVARKQYPKASLKRRKKIAGSIIGGSRSKKNKKRR